MERFTAISEKTVKNVPFGSKRFKATKKLQKSPQISQISQIKRDPICVICENLWITPERPAWEPEFSGSGGRRRFVYSGRGLRFWLLPAPAGQAFAEHARFLEHSQGDSRVSAGNRLCHDVSGHVGRFEQPGTSRLAKFLLPGLVRRGELRIGSDPSPQRRARSPPSPRRRCMSSLPPAPTAPTAAAWRAPQARCSVPFPNPPRSLPVPGRIRLET